MLYSKSLKQDNNAPTIRTYIEGKTLLGITQVCIPRDVNNISKNSLMSHTSVSKWVAKF